MSIPSPSIAVIGGGLAGLSAAITVAKEGASCTLFEAAPQLGGRTSSWQPAADGTTVDHGPHLLLGCYHHLLALMAHAGASNNIHWQESLTLPLWSADRGHFALTPKPWLPLQIALPIAVTNLPGHDLQSLTALIRLTTSPPSPNESVQQWLQRNHIPPPLIRDLLEPLCLGSMNEGITSANGESFATVLNLAFSSHQNGRIGWFRHPLSISLITPLESYARQLGVTIHTRCRIRTVQPHSVASQSREYRGYDKIILAIPAKARNRLLSIEGSVESRSITNYHLWFDHHLAMPSPLVGGIGTVGQWFFDIDAMTNKRSTTHHYCIVISDAHSHHGELYNTLIRELSAVADTEILSPVAHKRVTIHHATHPVRNTTPPALPPSIVDSCEQPLPGELPATMERAVATGYNAAMSALQYRH
ncbi:MAG: FAD-dependent oxidoreductase [Mariprofundales bacterium]|nr:FAD-dependent oxidoreductase [Mariprofundales bacterium]